MRKIMFLFFVFISLSISCNERKSDSVEVSKKIDATPKTGQSIKNEQPKKSTRDEYIQDLLDWLKNPIYRKVTLQSSKIELGGSLGSGITEITYKYHYDLRYADESYEQVCNEIAPQLIETLDSDLEDFIVEKICRVLRESKNNTVQKKLIEFCLRKDTCESQRMIVLENISKYFRQNYNNDEMIELTELLGYAERNVRIMISEMIREFNSKDCNKLLIDQFKKDSSDIVKLSLAMTLFTLNAENKKIILPYIHELLHKINSNYVSYRDPLFNLISIIKSNETLEVMLKIYNDKEKAAPYLVPDPICYYNTDERAAKALCQDLENIETGYYGQAEIIVRLKNFDFDCTRTSVLKVLAERLKTDAANTKGELVSYCLYTLKEIGNQNTIDEMAKLKGVNTGFDSSIESAIYTINKKLTKH